MTSATAALGAWRDRTNLYISYRQSYAHHPSTKRSRFTDNGPSFRDAPDSERAGLMSNLDADGDAVIEMDLLPPRWLDVQDEITAQLSAIAGLMKRLDTLHAKHVLPGFDDEAVKAKEEREIETLTTEVTRGFGACQRAIKRIDTVLRSGNASSSSEAEEKMARNLQISLATRVGETSTLFRKKQSAYLRKLRTLGGLPATTGTPRSATPTLMQGAYQNPYTDPALADDLSSAQTTLQQTQQSALRHRGGVHDSVILQREREIEKIAQGVIDLSQIFQELNSMVIDQGSLLDRIDYNVERTAEHTKEAEKELRVATGYQKRGTRRMIILLLVLLVVGMFILVLVKPRKRGGSGEVPGVIEPPGGGQGVPPAGGRVSARGVRVGEEVWSEWKKRRRRTGLGSGEGRMPL